MTPNLKKDGVYFVGYITNMIDVNARGDLRLVHSEIKLAFVFLKQIYFAALDSCQCIESTMIFIFLCLIHTIT